MGAMRKPKSAMALMFPALKPQLLLIGRLMNLLFTLQR